MRLRYTSGVFCIGALVCMLVTSALAETTIGKVQVASEDSYVLREDEALYELETSDPVFLGDLLGTDEGGEFSVLLLGGDQANHPIKIHEGEIRFVGNFELINCQVVKGDVIFGGPPESCVPSSEKIKEIDATGTLYQVSVRGADTRVFVYEGSVDVYGINPEFPEPQPVHAGEWVRADDDGISKPQRFMWPPTPGSGSKECIYSNCKQTDDVLIPQPPVYTPWILIPPPDPNPPGQR